MLSVFWTQRLHFGPRIPQEPRDGIRRRPTPGGALRRSVAIVNAWVGLSPFWVLEARSSSSTPPARRSIRGCTARRRSVRSFNSTDCASVVASGAMSTEGPRENEALVDDAPIYGVAVAIVRDNRDPNGLARVKVGFPWHSRPEDSYWARLATPMAGKGYGVFFLPE